MLACRASCTWLVWGALDRGFCISGVSGPSVSRTVQPAPLLPPQAGSGNDGKVTNNWISICVWLNKCYWNLPEVRIIKLDFGPIVEPCFLVQGLGRVALLLKARPWALGWVPVCTTCFHILLGPAATSGILFFLLGAQEAKPDCWNIPSTNLPLAKASFMAKLNISWWASTLECTERLQGWGRQWKMENNNHHKPLVPVPLFFKLLISLSS